jgi:hypothetical protein
MSYLPQTTNASTDSYYYLPYTLPVHLPGLVSTNPADSPHMPLPQKALPPEVPGYTDIQPERMGTDFGMETSFKYIPNDYEVLKECILMVRLAPLVAGSGGADPCYPDDPIFHALEYYTYQVGGQTVYQRWGDEVHFKELVEDNPDEYTRKNTAQQIFNNRITVGTDTDSRVFRANIANYPIGQWFMVELPFWWSDSSAKHWHQYACQRQTRITLKWRNKETILQQYTTDNVPTPNPAVSTTYIAECFLRFRVSALDTSVKDTFTEAVKAQGSNGLNYLIQYNQRQENVAVAAGTTSVSIQLTNFNKPTYMLRFVVRKADNVNSSKPPLNDRWSLVPIASYYLEASGHRPWPLMNSYFAKYMVNGREFLNNPEHEVMHVLHTDYPDVNQYPMGSIEYAKLQNPTLTINFPAALTDDSVVDVWAYCYDYLRLVISSDNRSAVALEQPI